MKRKLTYPLLILVVVLWGVIFHRVFSGGDGASSPPAIASIQPTPAVRQPIYDSLQLDYPDPFLGDSGVDTVDLSDEGNDVESEESAVEMPYVDWSQVQYLGLIHSDSDGKAVVLVTINGKEHMLKRGDTVDGYMLSGQQGSTIEISYQGQVTTIGMEQGNIDMQQP